jgi:hypothetical protein
MFGLDGAENNEIIENSRIVNKNNMDVVGWT